MKLMIDFRVPFPLEDQLAVGKSKAKIYLFCISTLHHHHFLHKLDYYDLEG